MERKQDKTDKVKTAYQKRRRKTMNQQEYYQEVQDINAAYGRLFSTDDGKFVLDHLIQHNLAVPIAQQGDTYLDIGVRQGRANLVDEIIQRLEVHLYGAQEIVAGQEP